MARVTAGALPRWELVGEWVAASPRPRLVLGDSPLISASDCSGKNYHSLGERSQAGAKGWRHIGSIGLKLVVEGLFFSAFREAVAWLG